MAVMHKTYQVRAYTTPAGYDRLGHVLRSCAQLYNAALEEWKAAYRHKGHSLSVSRTKFDQMKELTWYASTAMILYGPSGDWI